MMATKQREESLFRQSALIHMFANFFWAIIQSCFQQEIHEPNFCNMWIDQPYFFGGGLVRDVVNKQVGATNHAKEAAKKQRYFKMRSRWLNFLK